MKKIILTLSLFVSSFSYGMNNNLDLLEAVEKEDLNAVKKLLKKRNTDVNQANSEGTTPLHVAIGYETAPIALMLLAHKKIDVNKGDHHKRTPLIFAALSGDMCLLKMLLDHANIKVNQADQWGNTPLIKATRYKHTEMVKTLVKKGADTQQPDNNQLTAYDHAKIVGYYDDNDPIMKLLKPIENHTSSCND